MDSLFVEEVAASLVREFLSRKVRGATLHGFGRLLQFGVGAAGAPRHPLRLRGLRGGKPSPAGPAPEMLP